MSLPNDKDFELAVDKAIDEIFGKVESPEKEIVEENEAKTQLELEPINDTELKLDLEPATEENKVIDFPQLEETLSKIEKEEPIEEALTQDDLEKIAAALLSLEWEVTPETSFEFLTILEEAKQKAPLELHPIFDLLHEVGTWLKDRPEEARPEWLHFLHQGIVALNLVVVHKKDPEPYLGQLRQALNKIKKGPETEEEKIKKRLIKQLAYDYQRFVMFDWLFSRSPKTKHWKTICTKALKEIEEVVSMLPKEEQPNLEEIKTKILQKVKKPTKQIEKTHQNKEPQETKKELPFKEAYHCICNGVDLLIPAEEVAYFGNFDPKWQSKMNGQFPLVLLLGFWRFFSIVKLKNKMKGELSLKDEKTLRNLSLPILKKGEEPLFLLVLWKNDKGGVVLAEDASLINIPEEAYYVSKGSGGSIFIGKKEYIVFRVS
ncbi:hypothetical protein [Thermodesulfatator atlanticus]|uniref:hypothetical protein n=1 Tax=Thermodesulfatator atlanticus TaxID=501497 RepID=UPI0003B628B7|nr:hypothetical protein [Thermodesulfatator atlanticus]